MRELFERRSAHEKAKPPQPTIKFDVMLHERWICTMKMPMTFTDIIEYQGDTPIYDISKLQEYVETQRPSLTGKPYNIEFITEKPKFRS